jgi:two-component system nitrate/nitrite response regulator NarL
MSEIIRLAVIDDHPIFRSGLHRALSRVSDVRIVAEGASAEEACRIADGEEADVMLLDITMPGGGIEALRAIRAGDRPLKIIMLTGSDDDERVADTLAAGANGYLLKGISATELIDAVRTVYGGRPYITPALSSRMLIEKMRAQRSSERLEARLNRREQEVLEYAAKGLSNKDIAATMGLTLATVKNYMSRILQKLQVRSRSEAVARLQKR